MIMCAQVDFECAEEGFLDDCLGEIAEVKLLKVNRFSILGGENTTLEFLNVFSKR